MDKIRNAMLTAAGVLDKNRAKEAKSRAGGQIAPSTYLPGVPRQAHADGGRVDGDQVEFDDLHPVTQSDIMSHLAENIPDLSKETAGGSRPEWLAPHMKDLVDPLVLKRRNMPINAITGYNRLPSQRAVSGYTDMLSKSEAPPILVDGSKFVDGGHRYAAYKAAGRKNIPTVDIGPLLRMNWKSWLEGDTDESHPVKSRLQRADGGEVTDLGAVREQKQLQGYHKGMMGDLKDRMSNAMEAHQKAMDAGVFDGYEVGDMLQGSAHPMRITGRYMQKWKPTPMALQSFDRMGTKPTIIEHEGQQYIPMLRYQTGAEGQDGFQEGAAYLDGVKAAGYQKMGGLRSVKAAGGAVPQKTVKAYKLFRTKGDGKLYPLFVHAEKPVPMGQWLEAEEGPQGKAQGKVKSKLGDLAYRPGWHAGDLPMATHIGGKSDPSLKKPDYRPDNHVWAEVEMAADKDWQSVADSRGRGVKAHITDQVPYGGFYRYKTNPNMTGNWLIGGHMKVNRVLSDDEVQKINDQAGVADLPRLDRIRRADGGSVAERSPMFEGMSEHLMDDEGKPMELWHGTPGAGFEAFDDAKLGRRDAGFYGRGHYLTPIKGNAEGYADPDEMGTGTVMGPLHAALKNPYVWDTSDAGSHRTLRDLQSMGIMKGQGKLEPWDNLQRHHIDPFMREMKNRGHDGVLVKGNNGLSEVVVFKPNMIKHRDAEVFDPNDPRIMRATGGRTLYSRAAEIIRGLPQEKGTVDQLIAAAKARGAKPSELEHAGRPDGDKITREELAKHFESRLPKLKIEQYGENPSRLSRDEDKRRIELQNRDQLGRGEPLSPEEKTEQERLNRRLMSSPNVLSDEETEEPLDTNYGDYVLPGGQNYRERLISLQRPKDPRQPLEDALKKATQMAGAWPEGHRGRERYDEQAAELRQKLDAMPPRQYPQPYQSNHWAGHPNVLAHIRLTDRTVGEDRDSVRPIAEKLAQGLGVGIRDLASGAASVGIQNKIITPEEAASLSRVMGWRNGYDQARGIGKRLLHVEELQSDWAQEGRDKGFHDPNNPYEIFETKTGKTVSKHPTYEAMWDAFRSMPDEQSAGLDYGSAKNEKPAEGPYVTNTQHWTDLALKHVLHEAAHGNYDGIVFTPGQAQADRYGLEKQVDNLSYHPSTKTLMAMKGNRVVFSKDGMEPEEVASHVGRDVSQRLIHPDAMQKFDDGDSFYNISGDDLKMGGEGMKGYYDNIVPKSVMRLAQQHDPEAKASGPVDLGQGYSGFHLPMTDTLKNSVIDKGFSAFKRGGKVDKALAITRSFTKDGRAATMQLKAKGD